MRSPSKYIQPAAADDCDQLAASEGTAERNAPIRRDEKCQRRVNVMPMRHRQQQGDGVNGLYRRRLRR